MVKQEKPIVHASELTLSEWLNIILKTERSRKVELFPNYCFPTETHRDEYLSKIATREQAEIRSLLRIFLIPTGYFGNDYERLHEWIKRDPIKAGEIEQVIRVINGGPVWEGLTWVLDLLHRPQMAIDVIHAYLAAHFWWMPDWRINGLFDAMSLIRASYLDTIHPRDTLLALTPQDFELLVALLFKRLRFSVSVTQKTRDGGCDIKLISTTSGKAESSVVECKRYAEKPIGVKDIRALLGVVERDGATRGLFVVTSKFTDPAVKEASLTNRIELIGYEAFCVLLNEHFGPEWRANIDRILQEAHKEFDILLTK